MKTFDDEFAPAVWKQVSAFANRYITEPEKRAQYRSLARSLPMLLHRSGLAQAMAFLRESNEQTCHDLLAHLAEMLANGDESALLEQSRRPGMDGYQYLTHRVRIILAWNKRFAESLLENEYEADQGA